MVAWARSRWLVFCGVTLFGCGGDTAGSDTLSDAADTSGEVVGGPAVAFTSPSPGQVFSRGSTVAFVVEASHPTIAPTALEVTFTSQRVPTPLGTARPNAVGLATFETDTLPGGSHTITAMVVDGEGRRASATLDIKVNSPPSTPVIALAPENPSDDDDITVTLVQPSVDPEGDTITYRYRWLKNGTETGLQNDTLPAAATSRGETWKVFVTPSDGLMDGLPSSAETNIGNSPPRCEAALILPTGGTTQSPFTCSCTNRSDPDAGDTVADTCVFEDQDGEALGPNDGACTLDPSFTERGMFITCTLTPTDGFAYGAPVTTTAAEVFNSPPTAPAVSLTPTSANANTHLTCAVTTPGTDADGDSLTTTFEWMIGDSVVSGTNAPTLEAGLLAIEGRTARRGDGIRCRAWSEDGLSRSSAPGVSALVVLDNAVPESGAVQIRTQSGQPATAAETLVCGATGLDRDGDTLTAIVTWTVSGEVVDGVTGTTLSGEHFARGDVVSCTLSFSDGFASSPPEDAKSAVTIRNALPTLTSVTLTPTNATRTDVFACAHQGWADADGDPVEVAYAWVEVTAAGDVPLAETSATLASSALDAGDRVACIVTPRNGTELGAPVRSNTASVANTPPTLSSVTLSPSPAYANSTLTCTASGYSDPDGQPASYVWAWTRNGTPLAQTSATLTGPFVKGDRYRCFATPSDGIDAGPQVGSLELTIQNSLPSIASASVSPANGGTCAAFTCVAQGVSDPDPADTVGFATTWIVNGTAVGPTLTGLVLAPGDALSCRLSPTDGTVDMSGQPVYGTPTTSSAMTVVNAPPSITSVTVTPSDAGVGDLLRCLPSGWTDDCTTTPSYSYEWRVDGITVMGASAPTFDSSGLRMGDEVVCRVTPRDPHGAGTPISSAPLALGPGDAVAPTVEVHAPAGADGDVTCRIVQPAQWFTNPSYTYYWRINGQAELVAGATLTAEDIDVRHCDLVRCRVVVSDAAATLSSQEASAQMPLGSDCDDGNDCTSSLCAPTGGCGPGVLESGIPCTSADPCEQGECLGGVCQGLVDLCVEEPIASHAGPAYPGPWDLGGYGLVWADTVRLTDHQESRVNETRRIDSASTGFTTSPTRLEDGSFVVLSEIGPTSVLNRFGNATSSSRLDARLLNALGDLSGVAFTTPTISHSFGASANSFSSTIDRVAFPLFVSGAPAVVTSVRRGSKMDSGNFSYTFSDIFYVPTVGSLAGQHITFVPNSIYNAGTKFHAAVSPPGGHTTLVAWVPTNDANRIWWWVKRFDGETLVNIKNLIFETPSTATIQNLLTAGRSDGGWVVAWTASQNSQTDVFAARVSSDGTGTGTTTSQPAFRVNTATAGNQVVGGVGSFSDSGFVVVWDDNQVDGLNNPGVMAQLFTADGQPDGPPIRVNTFTAGAQSKSQLAMLDDDEWLVTWHDATLNMLMTRRFYRDGAPVPGPRDVLVSATTLGDQRDPAGASSIGASETTLVAWSSPIFLDEGTEIAYRVLGKTGRPIGQEQLANVASAGDQRRPTVAGSTDRFLLTWESGEVAGRVLLVGRYLDLQGNPLGDPFPIDPNGIGDQRDAAIAVRPAAHGSGFAVVWTEGDQTSSEIKVRRFLADGTPAGPAQLANATTADIQSRPAVTSLASGVLVLGWQSQNQVAGGGFDLYMRTLTPGAQSDTLGTERRINTTTIGDQTNLALLAAPTGFLAACWDTPDPNASTDVVCQTFTTNNFAVRTAEFPLATVTTGLQRNVALTLDATGSLLAAWESDGIDVAGRALLVRRFSAQGPATGVRVMAHRFAGGDQTEPWLAPLASGPFWVGWMSSSQDGSGTGVYARLLEP